jgi:hypothetical protein
MPICLTTWRFQDNQRSRLAEAPGSRTQPAPEEAATDFEDREGHRAPFASVPDHIVGPVPTGLRRAVNVQLDGSSRTTPALSTLNEGREGNTN